MFEHFLIKNVLVPWICTLQKYFERIGIAHENGGKRARLLKSELDLRFNLLKLVIELRSPYLTSKIQQTQI